MQFASLKREGVLQLKDNDAGFYSGLGAGFMINLSEIYSSTQNTRSPGNQLIFIKTVR